LPFEYRFASRQHRFPSAALARTVPDDFRERSTPHISAN
jgi:hypothetical protein